MDMFLQTFGLVRSLIRQGWRIGEPIDSLGAQVEKNPSIFGVNFKLAVLHIDNVDIQSLKHLLAPERMASHKEIHLPAINFEAIC